MTIQEPTSPEPGAEQRSREIQRKLSEIERHNWSLWIIAGLIIFSLTFAVAILSIPSAPGWNDAFYQFRIGQMVRGLVGLVLLFSLYTLYQQVQLKRMRLRLAEQIEIAGRQQVRAEEFLKLAMTDPLTGLHNRRYFDERLAAEMSRVQRHKGELTVLMIDVDDFKRINDRYGHTSGDLALKMLAERLSRAIRGSDLAARVGGDEFLVLLPDCKLGQVQIILDRIYPLEIAVDSEKVSFAFSAGWTDYQENETPQCLIARADHALYANKQLSKEGMTLSRVN